MLYTLHKSLSIAFPAVSIFILGLSVDFVCAKGGGADRFIKFDRLTVEDGLGLKPTTFESRMKKLGITRPQ